MEEEGRQDQAPRRGDAEEVVGGDGDEQEPGADGGDLHGVPEDRDRDREWPPAPPGSDICSVCHEPWASSGAHRICCIPCGHVYGRSCLELWLARSQSRSRSRGTPAAAKCLWCEQEFRREDMINLYGATEHLLEQQQVATEEQLQQQEEEAEEAAARQWQQQAGHGHVHDLQEAAADAIARMNEGAGVAVARRNPNGEAAAAAAGFSWRNGAVAWKRVGLAWRIDAPPLVAADGDGDGAVAEVAAGAPAAGSNSSVVLLLQWGVGILVFIVAALLCLIM